MPIYEYQCQKCRTEFEKLIFSKAEDTVECPACSSPDVKKKISAASLTKSSAGACLSGPSRGFS